MSRAARAAVAAAAALLAATAGAAPADARPLPTATAQMERAEAAAKILQQAKDGKITIVDYSEGKESDTKDRSLASMQLQDIANGGEAHLSERCANNKHLPRTTPGDVGLLRFLADLGDRTNYKLNVLFGQCHSVKTSLHYVGQAVDLGCPTDTKVADEVAGAHGIRRNGESCAKHHHFHYSVGGK